MLPATPTLETARLILRPLAPDAAPAIQRHFPQWAVVEFLDARVPWPYPADGAATYIRDIALPAMAERREWHWTLSARDWIGPADDNLLGVISLMRAEDNNRGFWLRPEWRGRGLMTEACAAVTAFWFEDLDQPVLRVPKAVANQGSRRLSERTGMRLVGQGEKDYVSGPQPSELWELTRADWRARQTSNQPTDRP
jgi:RimJ/RimL family protein N-acetyltransferase